MTPALIGGVCGLGVASGLLLVGTSVLRNRRPSLVDRVAPYLKDVPVPAQPTDKPVALMPATVWWAVFGPSLQKVARGVEQILGGSQAVRRRQRRLGIAVAVEKFRVEQVLWGIGGFVAATAIALVWSLRSPLAPLPALMVCLLAFVAGVLARDQALSRAVQVRERRMVEEFPTVADLMALSVAAGEGPVAALERVVDASRGELSIELRRVLAEIRTGTPIAQAFDALASRTGLSSIARFSEGLAIAVERGTPLVDVLHAQAADVREASRRSLIESGARKEVVMMMPVVFLILPITIVFAFFPGAIGLNLTSP